MTTVYRGAADVARWCGVSRSAVSNWLRRFPDGIPQPDVIITTEVTNRGARSKTDDDGIKGWLPERREEWETFAAKLRKNPARTANWKAAATRRSRSAAEQVIRGMETGEISPDAAARLLRELIGRPEKHG